MKLTGSTLLCAALLSGATLLAQTNSAPPGATNETARVIKRAFRDYTFVLLTKPDEPWQTSWNDAGQMGVLSNPSNNAVITCQFLKFPVDPALQEAVGHRDEFMDAALRKYCATVFALSKDPDLASQPVNIVSRTLGDHYFRYCPILGRDRNGRREGFFYIMLRGPANRPDFTGDSLILTIGFPELIAPEDQRRALKTFDILLQNISFY
jgi:hypothetical protein